MPEVKAEGTEIAKDTNDLNALQRQRVDQAFENLFGYKWNGGHQEEEDRSPPTTTSSAYHVLAEILGRRAAARLLRSHQHLASVKLVAHRKKQDYRAIQPLLRPPQLPVPLTCAAVSRKTGTNRIASTARQPPVVVELKTGPVPAKKKLPAQVDTLLQQLTGPNKVSTVAKTHSDWDQFKEKSGLAETLEEQADSKTAFLKKQDFLQRVDHRTFEQEKKQRESERSKRGN